MQLSTGSILNRIQARPRMIAGMFLALVWLWIGWQISHVAFDRDLSETDLISKQVRVQQERLDQLTQALETYRTPTPVVKVPTTPFVTSPEE